MNSSRCVILKVFVFGNTLFPLNVRKPVVILVDSQQSEGKGWLVLVGRVPLSKPQEDLFLPANLVLAKYFLKEKKYSKDFLLVVSGKVLSTCLDLYSFFLLYLVFFLCEYNAICDLITRH